MRTVISTENLRISDGDMLYLPLSYSTDQLQEDFKRRAGKWNGR